MHLLVIISDTLEKWVKKEARSINQPKIMVEGKYPEQHKKVIICSTPLQWIEKSTQSEVTNNICINHNYKLLTELTILNRYWIDVQGVSFSF